MDDKTKNYLNAVYRNYFGVVIMIDDLLYDIENHKEVLDELKKVLEKRVPVVFLTSFGKEEVKPFKDNLLKELTSRGASRKELERINIITNNGSRLLHTTPFNENILETVSDTFEMNGYFYSVCLPIDMNLQNHGINPNRIDIDIDTLNEKSITVRAQHYTLKVELTGLSEEDRLFAIETANKYVNHERFNEGNKYCISIEKLNGKEYLLVNIADKNECLKKVGEVIGVPAEGFVFIGSKGDKDEADYQILNRENAFSVKTRADSNEGCFFIKNDEGKELFGDEAIVQILRNATFIPPLCLESIKREFYSKDYSLFEKQMVEGANEQVKRLNEIINKNFGVQNGIYDVFDKETGAVYFPNYEWDLIDKLNPFKLFFNMSDGENFLTKLRDDDKYLLRGSGFYYYLLANRDVEADSFSNYKFNATYLVLVSEILMKLITQLDEMKKYRKANEEIKNGEFDLNEDTKLLFARALHYKEHFNVTNNITNNDKRFLLAILDNLRNILLIILNFRLDIDSYSTSLVDLDSLELSDINTELENIERIMSFMCFGEYEQGEYDFIKLVDMCVSFSLKVVSDTIGILNEKSDRIVSRNIKLRSYRENDNFAENYVAMKIVHEQYKDKYDYGICTLAYGGLELPYIYASIANDKYRQKSAIVLSGDDKSYMYKHSESYSDPKHAKHRYFLQNDHDVTDKNLILLDDNIMSGKTLQIAVEMLIRRGYNVDKIGIVKYPDISRISHMFKDGHGAVDYRLFMDYIIGLSAKSNYTWQDSRSMYNYEDSLGYFDKTKKKIIECLIKNYDYTEGSEVAAYWEKIKPDNIRKRIN